MFSVHPPGQGPVVIVHIYDLSIEDRHEFSSIGTKQLIFQA